MLNLFKIAFLNIARAFSCFCSSLFYSFCILLRNYLRVSLLSCFIVFLFSFHIASASWTSPSQDPPGANVGPPIFASSTFLQIIGDTGNGGKLRLSNTQSGNSAELQLQSNINGSNYWSIFSNGSSNGDLSFSYNSNNYFIIDTNGNVGIGTTSPSQDLVVSGDVRITGELIVDNPQSFAGNLDMNEYVITNIGDPDTDFDVDGGLSLAGNLAVYGLTPTLLNSGAALYGPLTVYPNSGTSTIMGDLIVENILKIGTGSAYFTDNSMTFTGPTTLISGSGDVKIESAAGGNTLVNVGASDHFVVNKKISSSTTQALFYVDASNGYIGIGTTSPSQYLTIDPGDDNTPFSFNTNLGRQGIGTRSPQYLIDSLGTPTSTAIFNINNTGTLTDTGLRLARDSSEKWFIGALSSDNKLVFKRNAATIDMVINELGNIGIGTTSPSKLFVIGNANQFTVDSSGNTSVAGTLNVEGVITTDNDLIVGDVAGFSNTSTKSDIYVEGNLEVDGDVSLGDVITDDVIITGNLIQTGDIIQTGNTGFSGVVTITSTATPQIKVRYDASNYYDTNVASNGSISFDATGDGESFTFQDDINVNGTSTLSNIKINNNNISATNDDGVFILDNAGAGIFVQDGGNLGIGTTSPSQKLVVDGSGIISGNLGIGTSSPAQNLAIEGNALINGNLNVTSTSTSENLKVQNNALVQNNLDVTSTTTTGNLEVLGNSVFNSSLDYIDEFADGQMIDMLDVVVTSNGSEITISIEKSGGGSFLVQMDGEVYSIDATSTTLTEGADDSPAIQSVYINENLQLTKRNNGFPIDEKFAPIATLVVQSAASVQSDGVYKLHIFADNIDNHLSHINNWIFSQHATWLSGGDTTYMKSNGSTLGYNDYENDIYVRTDAASVSLLHEQAYPAFNTLTGSDIYVVNDPDTPYRKIQDLTSITETSDGQTIWSNRRYSLVLWGAVNKETNESKLFLNLPSDTYARDSQALEDPYKYSNYNIPAAYRGTGFLISRITLRYRSGSGWRIVNSGIHDLRGQSPSIFAGGTAGVTTEFSSNDFIVYDSADSTSDFSFDFLEPGTPNTTRILTVQDVDGTIAYLNDINTTVANYLPLTGGDMSGNIGMASNTTIGTSTALWLFDGVNEDITTLANIGIGTTTPSKLLHVEGDTLIAGDLIVSGTSNLGDVIISSDAINFNTASTTQAGENMDFNTNGNTRLTILADGKVGIGTTSPVFELDVVGDVNYTGDLRVNGEVAIFGDLSYGSSASSSNDVVYVDDNGNVGIGTTSPNYTLDVAGMLNAGGGFIVERRTDTPSSPVEGQMWLRTDLDYDASILDVAISDGGTGTSTVPGNGQMLIGNINNSYDLVSTTSLRTIIGLDPAYLYIDSNGNIGIGTTTPTAKLDIAGNFSVNGPATSTINNNLWVKGELKVGTSSALVSADGIGFTDTFTLSTEQGDAIIEPGVGGNTVVNISPTNHFVINKKTSSTTNAILYVDAVTDFIAIGTTTPSTEFEVNRNTLINGDLTVSGTSNLGNVVIESDLINFNNASTTSAVEDMQFRTGGNSDPRLTITSEGNIGIGTTSPQAALDINGDLKIRGTGTSTIEHRLWVKDEIRVGTSSIILAMLRGLQFTRMAALRSRNGDVTLEAKGGDIISDLESTRDFIVNRRDGATTTPLFNIDADTGFVGIGTTEPSQALDIVGNIFLTGTVDGMDISDNLNQDVRSSASPTFNNLTINGNIGIANGNTIGTGSDIWTFDSTNNDISTLSNVGIGTAAPSELLHVVGNSKIDGDLTVTGTSNLGNVIISSDLIKYNTASTTQTGENMEFKTNGQTRFIILANGNIGIGTTSPSAELVVNGDISADSFIGSGTGLTGVEVLSNKSSANGYASLDSNTLVPIAELPEMVGDSGSGGSKGVVPAPAVGDGIKFLRGDGTWIEVYNQDLNITDSAIFASVGIGTSNLDSMLTIQGTSTTPLAHIKQANGETALYMDQFGNISVGTSSVSDLFYVYGGVGIDDGNLNMNLNDITGVDKLTVATIDPLYNINNVKYSTYAPSMAGGVKEEVVGSVNLIRTEDGIYQYIIDFSDTEVGSNLWLFKTVTDFGENWENLVVNLTPSFNGKSWYEKDIINNNLIINAIIDDQLTKTIDNNIFEVSYHFIANRFDWAKWPNLAPNQEERAGLSIVSEAH